jgi:hypothetical protein
MYNIIILFLVENKIAIGLYLINSLVLRLLLETG